MAETSKNKIYYNDNENSVADVLADMKKMAESTDKAIENSKYNDEAIKKSISDVEKKQVEKNTEQDSKIVELQTEKAKLETELKEMQEDFYQNSIRGQASGEYIHVEDSSNCRARIGISGNSEQETREGYNLLNFDVKQDSKVTYNKEDGTVTINGQGGFYLNLDRINLTANKTYKQKLEFISGSAKTISGTDMKNQAVMSLKTETWLKNDNYIAYTPEADTTKSGLWLNANVNFDNAKIRIWAYKGTEDKGYEQYGAMPNPNYSSEIVTVGQNVNELANLIQTQIINGVEITKNNDGSLTFNGTATSGITINLNNESGKYFNAISGSSYTISLQNNSGLYFRLRKVSENTNIATFDSPSKGITFTSNYTGECFAYLVIIKDTTFDNLTIYPKLEKGTVATPYSPYNQGSVKVTKCNKNIFDGKLETGEYDVLGNKISNSGRYRNVNKITIEENETYFFSIDGVGKNYVLFFYDKNGNFLTTGNTDNYKVKTPSHAKYMNFRCFVADYVADYSNLKIQIEKNTIETPFEQHEEQSYIMPVQKEMLEDDYFDWDNEEEVHTWGKSILTGDEEIMYSIAQGDYYLFQIRKNDAMRDIPFVCNKFINASNWGVTNSRESIDNQYNSGTLMQFKVLSSRLSETSANGVKLWLKAQYDAVTPVVIYYKLQTPTRLAFTDEQKEVAKELSNARTYKNVTNITTDSKAILSLDYAKDLETLLNNTQALAVNNASEGV